MALAAAAAGINPGDYNKWGVEQINYLLGDNRHDGGCFSYEIGYGSKFPHHPHHRGAWVFVPSSFLSFLILLVFNMSLSCPFRYSVLSLCFHTFNLAQSLHTLGVRWDRKDDSVEILFLRRSGASMHSPFPDTPTDLFLVFLHTCLFLYSYTSTHPSFLYTPTDPSFIIHPPICLLPILLHISPLFILPQICLLPILLQICLFYVFIQSSGLYTSAHPSFVYTPTDPYSLRAPADSLRLFLTLFTHPSFVYASSHLSLGLCFCTSILSL